MEEAYQCIGYCQIGDGGYCLGCGRPADADPSAGAPVPAKTALAPQADVEADPPARLPSAHSTKRTQ